MLSRIGLVAASFSLCVAVLLTGCSAAVERTLPAHGTYAGMQKVADTYADVELERLTSGYFGRPLYSIEGAHVATPVPVFSVRADSSLTSPLLSRLEPSPDMYTVPVLNSEGEILGEYAIEYFADSGSPAQGWQVSQINRRGIMAGDLQARRLLGLSTEATTTLVSFGAVWSVAASGAVESGVAPSVRLDHNPYDLLPEPGRVYVGRELRRFFTPEARGR